MNLVQTALRRPLTIVAAVIAIVLGAGLALERMSRDIFPPLGVPTIYVAQPYGGMDPAQMEGYLTYYYEYHFLYITGIEHVESKSIQGASIMKLQFHPGTDMSQAMSEVIAYVNRARAFMPPGTVSPFVTRFDAGSVPVGYLTFSTDNTNRTVGEMQDAALNLVRPLFATLPGVSAPPPFGGSARTILVNVKPDRMRACNLSPDDIVQAVAQANTISPSGNVNLGDKYPIVPVNAVVKNIKDLEGVPLRVGNNSAVFLRDVATVEEGSDIVTSYALVNGRRTVYIPVTKRADASTLSVVKLVKGNLAKFQSVVPSDVKVGYDFDQSPVVRGAMKNLVEEGALGAILTGLMVLLFLRDWRTALIVVLNIPVSILAATFALWLSGGSMNLMTLGGLALAVGILVDEATVTIENVHAHIARGAKTARAAYDATVETTVPRLLAMLCVLAVFIPAFFMTGAARALFVPMALAVGFSMIASYLLSSTLVPVLAVWVLRSHAAQTSLERKRASMERLGALYGGMVRTVIRLRWVVVPVYIVAALLITWLVGKNLGVDIFPRSDAGQLAVRLRAPAGTRVENTEAIALRVLDIIKREAGQQNVALTIGLVGVHAPNYPINLIYLWNGGPEEGWLAVQFKPGANIRIEPFLERLRAVFANELPAVRFSFEPSDIVNRVMSFGASTPIEVAVSGPSLQLSEEHARKIYDKMKSIAALRDVQFVQALDFPTLDVNVDRERAGLLGVKIGDVTRSLVPATTSSRFTVANFWADPRSGVSYNLQVQIPQAKTTSVEDIQNVPISAANGKTVLLRNLATVSTGTAVGQYERYNMARVVSITANIHGADLGSVARQIERAIAEAGDPPPKTSVALRGQVVPLREVLGGFRIGLVVAVAVVFLLLGANFQSLPLSLVVISTVPAALAGVVLMLWTTGTTLNIESAMGAITAVGVAIANAILLVTFAERSRVQGAHAHEAGIQGAQSRLRPILMTSCAMIAGMLPMALGLGEGGGQTAPLGRSVIGGLIVATTATLFVLPAVFSIVRGRANRLSPSLDPNDEHSPHFDSIKASV
ncbi:MAG TPA: efflux RND transporter permease subunit [Verrucomicrobiae bacterium]|nr:efflux RND transporter permease subunit [Verrucomicrobiae bacterium]